MKCDVPFKVCSTDLLWGRLSILPAEGRVHVMKSCAVASTPEKFIVAVISRVSPY